MAILDQYGNPLQREILSEPQTARMSQLHREFATHPSRGLTPHRLAMILESAEQGDTLSQHDLFLDMEEKDAHIYAEMSKRKRAILNVPWTIEPPRNASAAEKSLAAYLDELVRDIPNIEDVLLDMMDAIGHGFACLEIEWEKSGAEWMPKAIEHRPQSWFRLDRETRTELRLRDNSGDGAPLLPFGWIAHVHRAKSGYIARAGLHRILAWPYLYKNYSVRDLAEFLEIYGLPMRIGKYPAGASDKEKSTLLAAVVGIGHNAAGILPEGMDIEIKEAAKGSQDPFVAVMQWAESSQSKAILGGTLTSQADGKTSTNALGNVHNEVRHDIRESDARQLSATLKNTLLYYLVTLNKGSITDPRRMPNWVFDTSEPADFALYAEALPKLAGVGAQIPVSWAHETLKIPMPQEGEPVLGQPSAAPAPTPAQTANLASLRAQASSADPIESLSASLAGDWREVITPWTDPIEAALTESIANGETAEQFLSRLPPLLQQMDVSALTERLARAAFAVRLMGEAGIDI
jgi:phage gp29-like protein